VYLTKNNCCHFIGICLFLTANAPLGARGKLFLPRIAGKNNNNKTTSEEQMKFNKWTYGLAAVGAVSLASAARADEHAVNTMLSSTTLSGYVDVAAQYNNGNQASGVFSSANKVDAFSVNNVTVSLDKPLDESAWAAGYHIDLNAGQANAGSGNGLLPGPVDAFAASTASHFSIRQAYVALRTPLGNGIDWKFGAWDTILGYETTTGYANPNYTRSYGYSVEPTSYVGLLGTYKVADFMTVNAGIANPVNPGSIAFGAPAGAGTPGLSSKNFLASVVLTAPENFGAFKGATLTMGMSQSFQSGGVNNYYAGLTLPTPIKALALGFAFDALQNLGEPSGGNFYSFGAYLTYQATDKLGLALRGEYLDAAGGFNGEEITATLSYNLWANVITRLEARWDHNDHGFNAGVGTRGYENAIMVALNVVYKF
jgi:hypothetical protein